MPYWIEDDDPDRYNESLYRQIVDVTLQWKHFGGWNSADEIASYYTSKRLIDRKTGKYRSIIDVELPEYHG